MAAAVLAVVMGLTLLGGCTPNVKQSLAETVTAFYEQVADGNNPYGSFGAAPLWPNLPVDTPQMISAEVETVADEARDGKWLVRAELQVGTGDRTVALIEETSWVREGDNWVLTTVAAAGAEFAGWSGSSEAVAGLLAFEHEGRVWWLDTGSGQMAQVVNPENNAGDGEQALHIDEWAPDGSGLLVYSEGATYWYSLAAGGIAKVADTGNYGGVAWSKDGRYGLVDHGTDVIRTVEVFSVAEGKVTDRLAAYGALWSPDGAIVIGEPARVTPEWPAGDGSSFSVVRIEIKQDPSGLTVLEPTTLAAGTSTSLYRPGGYGRDGELYYTQTELNDGGEVVTWYRWDEEAREGVRQTEPPVLDTSEGRPTVQVPSQLGGPRDVRVEVSEDGRWGVFGATEGDMGNGIYLIDLTAPSTWTRIVAGTNPRWMAGQ